MKILLTRTSSMGDLIHTFYAVNDLSYYYPDVELHWICEESFKDIPKLHPFVKKIYIFSWRELRKNIFSFNTWKFILKTRKKLKKEKYDFVIDSQGLIKSALIARLAGSPVYGFNKKSARESLASLFYNKKIHIEQKDNIIWKNRELFAKIFNYLEKINRKKTYCDLIIPENTNLNFLLKENNYHIFIIGTSADYKLWPEKNWQKLIKKIHEYDDSIIYLTWGNEKELERVKRIAKNNKFVCVCPKLSLLEISCLIKLSTSVIGVDTGLLHLANALSKVSVGIYVNTSKENTQVENCFFETVLGGINSHIDVDEVFKTWKKNIEYYNNLGTVLNN